LANVTKFTGFFKPSLILINPLVDHNFLTQCQKIIFTLGSQKIFPPLTFFLYCINPSFTKEEQNEFFFHPTVFTLENNCICLRGKTDIFYEWTINFGIKNNFNITTITLLLPQKKIKFSSLALLVTKILFFPSVITWFN